MIVTLTEENWEQVLSSNHVVMVDFWAPWCGPCRMVGPFIEELAEEYDGKAVVGKVNIDECPEIADQFGVTAIPTVMVFVDGAVADRAVGARPKASFAAMITSHLE